MDDANNAEPRNADDSIASEVEKKNRQFWLQTIGSFTPDARSGDPSKPAERWYERVVSAYSSPQRHYHNLEHIRRFFSLIKTVRREFRPEAKLSAFRIAAWFHDAVYDPRRTDNEEQSVRLLESAGEELKLPTKLVKLASGWILATKLHNPRDREGGAFCDADLCILGARESVYEDYRKAIRLEYDWVSEADYRIGRSKVLNQFLSRERIFRTGAMHDWLGLQARRNLSAELMSLGG